MLYNPALDGIRGIAVIFVLFHHLRASVLPRGYLGVDIFFVLSGFLITTLLYSEINRTGELRLWRFYFHRFVRLGPPLLAMLLCYLITAPFLFPFYPMSIHIQDVSLTAAYLTDYSRAFWRRPEGLTHTWSLSVEEHYYLLWPLGLLLLTRLNRGRFLGAMVAMYIIATGWRLLALQISDAEVVYPRFDTRMSGLILGGLLAICMPPGAGAPRWFRERLANVVGFVALLALCAAAAKQPYESGGSLIWGTIPVEWATACLIAAVVMHPGAAIAQWLSARALVAIGIVSYALYLWHFFIMQAIPGQPSSMWRLLTIVLSATAAAGSYFLIERPLRKFRSRRSVPVVTEAILRAT
jgi:peptidoglycan/LPS O-acetylase OafA/YrhL